jgi:phosphatidylethanolamine/phosphatidyl-N-methylethanolamine N-methyltransferase
MEKARRDGSVLSLPDVVRAYHRYAPVYDRIFGAVLEPGRRELARVTSSVCTAGQSLLEVGVGTGLMLPLYSGDFAVTGVDICEDMLAQARQRTRHLPARKIALQVMDGEKLDFPDGSFDCVTLPYVLSVTPDPSRLIAEVRRVCRKDGFILVLNHFNGSPVWWLLERMARRQAVRLGFRPDFSFEEHVLRNADWKVEQVRNVNLLDLSKLVTIRNA